MEQTIYTIYSLFMFVTGTLFGSFFTLATYRIPRKQDITHTRSYCPNCKHKLGFFDCFPILSYVSTIGRCKYCKQKISIRYPLIELANGFVFMFMFMIFGFSIETLVLLICYVYLFLVIGSDIMEKNMTEEEREEVKRIVEGKKIKKESQTKSKKKGAISVEVLVASVIFVFFFITAIYMTSNYSKTLALYKREVDATGILLNVMNEEKEKDFSNLVYRSDSVTIDNVTYNYVVNITNKLKDSNQELANVRNINVTVTYSLLGENHSVTLDSLKVVPDYEV
ncbi:MAG: prepilin peptidase [Clostridia bacterium]|nr:prepilin peptidase [Clostridia bacterium]